MESILTQVRYLSKPLSVAEHLSEGVSTKGTSRLVGVSAQTIRRLRRNLGGYSREFHDERVREVETASVQMDERWGYAGTKKDPWWEATEICSEVVDRRILETRGVPSQ